MLHLPPGYKVATGFLLEGISLPYGCVPATLGEPQATENMPDTLDGNDIFVDRPFLDFGRQTVFLYRQVCLVENASKFTCIHGVFFSPRQDFFISDSVVDEEIKEDEEMEWSQKIYPTFFAFVQYLAQPVEGFFTITRLLKSHSLPREREGIERRRTCG